MADEQDQDEMIFIPDTDLFWELYGLDLEIIFTPGVEED
jgi:hypothetical protein